MKSLESTLGQLGFEPTETELYLYLLRQGSAPVGLLSKRLGRPRTTLYSMLSRLHTAGLLRETTVKGLKSYSAEAPDVISHLFSSRIAAMQTSREQFESLLPKLRAEFTSTAAAPRLQIFEGRPGLHQVLSDMLLYGEITTAAVWPIKKMVRTLSPEFFLFHNRERIKRNIFTRAIWPTTEVLNVKQYPFLGWGPEFKREIRVAPESIKFSLGYWIYADKVAFLSSEEDGYGFIVQSAQLVDTLLAQFELLWNASIPLAFEKRDVESFLKGD